MLQATGNVLLRKLITENLVTFPAQMPLLAKREKGDLAQRLAQLYFIRGWQLRDICAKYSLSKPVVIALLTEWKSRAIESGFIQAIDPECVAAFVAVTTEPAIRFRVEESPERVKETNTDLLQTGNGRSGRVVR
jgi:hypothetical protein